MEPGDSVGSSRFFAWPNHTTWPMDDHWQSYYRVSQDKVTLAVVDCETASTRHKQFHRVHTRSLDSFFWVAQRLNNIFKIITIIWFSDHHNIDHRNLQWKNWTIHTLWKGISASIGQKDSSVLYSLLKITTSDNVSISQSTIGQSQGFWSPSGKTLGQKELVRRKRKEPRRCCGSLAASRQCLQGWWYERRSWKVLQPCGGFISRN